MSKIVTIIAIMFCVSVPSIKAQFIGFSAQYAQTRAGQFVSSVSIPTIHPKNKLNLFSSSGVEFSTSGGAKFAGLCIKPVQLSWFGTEDFFNKTPFTLLLQMDTGYLIDFRKGRRNAWILSPALYADYKNYFLKTGYDMDISHGQKGFFIRAGICLGLGTLKSFANTQIW